MSQNKMLLYITLKHNSRKKYITKTINNSRQTCSRLQTQTHVEAHKLGLPIITVSNNDRHFSEAFSVHNVTFACKELLKLSATLT